MSRPENFNVQELIDFLQGTCNSLQEGCDQFGMSDTDLTSDDHDEIDNQIFLCETCNWWCESSEQTEEGDCQDCYESMYGEQEED